MNIGTKKEENLQKSYNFFEDEIAKKQAVIKSVIIQLETIGECANLTTIRSRMHVCTVTTNKTIVQRFDEYMYSKLTKVAWLIYMRSNQLRSELLRFEAFPGKQLKPQTFSKTSGLTD